MFDSNCNEAVGLRTTMDSLKGTDCLWESRPSRGGWGESHRESRPRCRCTRRGRGLGEVGAGGVFVDDENCY